MPITLKNLIYTKLAGDELTQELLWIADSPTWLEDLIDYIVEHYEDGDIRNKFFAAQEELENMYVEMRKMQVQYNNIGKENSSLREENETLKKDLKKALSRSPVIGDIICPDRNK